ncbi:MAG: TIGR04076 family protein [Clostridia bacterium]|nr:TIGR04076 family protein [Clostridia bacterium]
MQPWIKEDWVFTITVVKGEHQHCRLGFEAGDEFTCCYAVPTGFCPKAMPVLHTLCEIIRCGGDFTHRGSPLPHEIDFPCPDGAIIFRLRARKADA